MLGTRTIERRKHAKHRHRTDSVYKIDAEGTRIIDGTPTSAAHWLDGVANATVNDGRITVRNASGSSNNKICFIDISLVTP